MISPEVDSPLGNALGDVRRPRTPVRWSGEERHEIVDVRIVNLDGLRLASFEAVLTHDIVHPWHQPIL